MFKIYVFMLFNYNFYEFKNRIKTFCNQINILIFILTKKRTSRTIETN
jgi:hypothetical protein